MPDKREYPLTKAYRDFFLELSHSDVYRTYSVAEFYCDRAGTPDPEKINIILRIDVDSGLHLCPSLADILKGYGIHASFYFLTFQRYYRLWGSGVVQKVAESGFEVGLHSDHYYEQLAQKSDGVAQLRSDIQRLGQESKQRVRGITGHGHPGINALGKKNYDLYALITPQTLGIDYHDGTMGGYHSYHRQHTMKWAPRADSYFSDFIGLSKSRGWNHYPRYPLDQLRKRKRGEIVHITIHSLNPFEYWRAWDPAFGEAARRREHPMVSGYKGFVARLRFGMLRGRSFPQALFIGGIGLVSVFLAKVIGLFWPKPREAELSKSQEAHYARIFGMPPSHWRNHVTSLGMQAPGGSVLEVGSGYGQWLLAFAQDAQKVIGIEPNEEYRRVALEKIKECPGVAEKITVRDGTAEALPFPDDSFDRVLCAGVFMFTQQQQALREMGRVLKPGGRMCLTVNGLGYFIMHILNGFRYKSIHKMYYGVGGLISTLAKWHLNLNIPFSKAVKEPEIKKMCDECGLTVQETRLFLPMELYPKQHWGSPTNYAFLIEKKARQMS